MSKDELGLLDYLHDAELVHLSFFVDDDGLKRLILRVICDADCGYEEWNACTIEVAFIDILLARGQLLGHSLGKEYVASLVSGLSDDSKLAVDALVEEGFAVPRMKLALLLQSGSELSIACDRMELRKMEGTLD